MNITMKKTLKLMLVALLAFGMFACGEKAMTEDDLKKAEATLFNEDMTTNLENAPKVVEKFCKYAEQHPDDANTPEWLFKALEISIKTKNTEKSIEIGNKLMKDYPDYEKTPAAMFILASFVYDDQLKDIDKARELYEKIISNYPESELVPSAEKSIEYLGLTPEEIMSLIQMSQMEVEEGEW